MSLLVVLCGCAPRLRESALRRFDSVPKADRGTAGDHKQAIALGFESYTPDACFMW